MPVLGDPEGVCVATIEHLLAAFVGLGVDNAVVEIDGAEVPVMDGSARAFVAAIDEAGIVVQASPRRFLKIRRPIRVELGSAFAEFRPYDGCRFEVGISYDCPVIGAQSYGIDLPQDFPAEVAAPGPSAMSATWSGLGAGLRSALRWTIRLIDGCVVINPAGPLSGRVRPPQSSGRLGDMRLPAPRSRALPVLTRAATS
jgi:hypothetical protein